MQGCLDRLDSFLFQVSRIGITANPSVWNMTGEEVGASEYSNIGLGHLKPESGLSFSAKKVFTDFESLLLHARATFDRLTLFVCDSILRDDS